MTTTSITNFSSVFIFQEYDRPSNTNLSVNERHHRFSSFNSHIPRKYCNCTLIINLTAYPSSQNNFFSWKICDNRRILYQAELDFENVLRCEKHFLYDIIETSWCKQNINVRKQEDPITFLKRKIEEKNLRIANLIVP